jgi:hypothetical protein
MQIASLTSHSSCSAGLAEVQKPAAVLEAPNRENWLKQLPAGIGQITRIRTPLHHACDVPPRTKCARAQSDDDGARSFERRASQDETRTSSTVPDPSLSRPVNPSRTYHLFALSESFHGLTSRAKSTSLKVERLSPCQPTSRRGGRFPPAPALRCQSVRSLRPSRTSQYG